MRHRHTILRKLETLTAFFENIIPETSNKIASCHALIWGPVLENTVDGLMFIVKQVVTPCMVIQWEIYIFWSSLFSHHDACVLVDDKILRILWRLCYLWKEPTLALNAKNTNNKSTKEHHISKHVLFPFWEIGSMF